MATYKIRGNSHNVIYTYKTQDGAHKPHWESYTTELEAMQRKTYIDYLQKNKRQDELLQAVREYTEKRAAARRVQEALGMPVEAVLAVPANPDNTNKTYREFAEKWLPFHARKERLSPNSYDSYRGNLDTHILPYFGDRVMSTITSEDVDNFIDHLSRKPCRGSKRFHKNPDEIPTLDSGTIKKCYTILMAGFPVAKQWRYVTEIPSTKAPAEKTKKRKAWEPKQVYTAMVGMEDDKLLHLAVHFAFVCSLRAGETAGIDVRKIDFHDRSFWVTQEVQRVSDTALSVIPRNEIIQIFPKTVPGAKSSLILKGPKTEGSVRKQYLTTPLLIEIRNRLNQIKSNREFFGEEYHDYGLLVCQPDGRPIDPKSLNKSFKRWQANMKIEDQIEFQGLRKSGQMHKVRLSRNNYQLVAENSGQSPEVLMSNYNEALESEKRTLSLMVETNFYPPASSEGVKGSQAGNEVDAVLQVIQNNPELSKQILQTLLFGAVRAKQDIVLNL